MVFFPWENSQTWVLGKNMHTWIKLQQNVYEFQYQKERKTFTWKNDGKEKGTKFWLWKFHLPSYKWWEKRTSIRAMMPLMRGYFARSQRSLIAMLPLKKTLEAQGIVQFLCVCVCVCLAPHFIIKIGGLKIMGLCTPLRCRNGYVQFLEQRLATLIWNVYMLLSWC